MSAFPEGNAIVYCDGSFNTPNGKTAHGLVRRTRRYRVLSVIDSRHAGADSGTVLDGRPNRIPVVESLAAAIAAAAEDRPATHFVVGLAPDGGRLPPEARKVVGEALDAGLHVDSGMHDFLSEDASLAARAAAAGVAIRDVRMPVPRRDLHFFSGDIDRVGSFRVAVLGTDSAVGKRTTAWLLVEGLTAVGHPTELIGTGQTAWMQGAEYCLILDSLINDFVAGEIEHAMVRAWEEKRPAAMVIEGQGSLMNPAYPGGFEILAAGRPDVIVLQHAPARQEYHGFPGCRMHSLETQIQALELLSGKPVVAVTVSHEDLDRAATTQACEDIHAATGVPAVDVLADGPAAVVAVLVERLTRRAPKH